MVFDHRVEQGSGTLAVVLRCRRLLASVDDHLALARLPLGFLCSTLITNFNVKLFPLIFLSDKLLAGRFHINLIHDNRLYFVGLDNLNRLDNLSGIDDLSGLDD